MGRLLAQPQAERITRLLLAERQFFTATVLVDSQMSRLVVGFLLLLELYQLPEAVERLQALLRLL